MFGFPREHGARRRSTVLRPIVPLEDRVVPTLFANPDFYTAEIGRVLTVPADEGLLENDFSDAFFGQVLTVQAVGLPQFFDANGTLILQPVPPNTLIPNIAGGQAVNPDGSFSIAVPSALRIPPNAASIRFTYTVTNTSGETAVGTVTVNIGRQATDYIAVGADDTGGPHVRVYESGSGDLVFNFFPYESTFRGGVRTATGDLNGDGIDEIVTVPAAGGSARVRVFDGRDGAPLFDLLTFDPNFRGGGYVAIGDFNGNGSNDLIVGAGVGGGPRIQVFELGITPGINTGFTILADFFAYDPNLGSFGVRVAAGDLEDLERDFIVTAPGEGGGSEVRVFDGNQVLFRPVAFPTRMFQANGTATTDSVFISVGDFRGDGKHDIVTGTGSGNGIVRIFDGRNSGLLREFRVPVDETFTGGGTASGPTLFALQNPPAGSLLSPALTPSSLIQAPAGGNAFGSIIQGGARVAVTDWNQDGIDDIIVGNGPGNPPRVRIFDTTDQTEFVNILAFSSTFLGGVNVSGS